MTAKRVGVALLGVALAAGTLSAAAQEPAGPPPPSSRVEDQGTAVLELLPALGRIGAQAGLLVGFSRNPYGVGSGVDDADDAWRGFVATWPQAEICGADGRVVLGPPELPLRLLGDRRALADVFEET